uniref:C2H2-type domain-containing protein n=1 Tax=viral metagenome TaxID=1070528 RepID=A0A6C0I5P2_9ZZZZ
MEKEQKRATSFSCQSCDFVCSSKFNWGRHIATAKHKILINPNYIPNAKKQETYDCLCGKTYKHKSSLCHHQAKCKEQKERNVDLLSPSVPTTQIIVDIMKQSQEIQTILVEQNKEMQEIQKQNLEYQKQILELSKQPNQMITNNMTTTTNHNHFNLQFFLNTTCKDALSINDFVNSLDIQVADLEETGKLGYIGGITRIIVNGLKDVDVNKRPLHCTDLKRETVYIKNDKTWEKENSAKVQLKKAVERVSNRNLQQIRKWQEIHPLFKDTTTKENDMFIHLSTQAIGASSNEEDDRNIEKIMKNVLKEVVLDKKI